MPRTRVISRIPAVSRIVVMMAAALVAVSALAGLPEAQSPGYPTTGYSTAGYSTVAQLSDTSPATPVVTGKCKKRCKKRYSDADLKHLTNGDVESVAMLGTVLAVIALAAVL